MGLPRYLHGHHPNPLRLGFDALRQKGYKLVGDVAKRFGVSENTVQRMEAEGVIPKARRVALARGKGVRVFTAKEASRDRGRTSGGGRSTPEVACRQDEQVDVRIFETADGCH